MTAMTTERTSVGWGLWLQWLIASTIGVVIGGFLAFGVMWSVSEAVSIAFGETAGFIVFGAVLGTALSAGLSIAQIFVVRAYATQPLSWVIGSLSAGLAGGSLAGLLTQILDWNAVFVIFGVLLGIPVGIAQWLNLRRSISRAGWWVAANGVGFVLFFVAATSLGGEGREFIALSAGGALFGAVSGLALVGLLRQPANKA